MASIEVTIQRLPKKPVDFYNDSLRLSNAVAKSLKALPGHGDDAVPTMHAPGRLPANLTVVVLEGCGDRLRGHSDHLDSEILSFPGRGLWASQREGSWSSVARPTSCSVDEHKNVTCASMHDSLLAV